MSVNDRAAERLTTAQQRAIASLLSARTIAEAAEQAGCSERTLRRWLASPPFKTALTIAEGEVIDGTVRRLLRAQDAAVITVVRLMASETVAAGVRLRAAQTVIDSLLRLRELRNVEDRLVALEARLALEDEGAEA